MTILQRGMRWVDALAREARAVLAALDGQELGPALSKATNLLAALASCWNVNRPAVSRSEQPSNRCIITTAVIIGGTLRRPTSSNKSANI